MDDQAKPLVIGIGGTASVNSSTEQALMVAVRSAAAAGARTQVFGGNFLRSLPHYLCEAIDPGSEAAAFVAAVRAADGIIVASPGYHGSISGLVKNAIDYLEEIARDARPYLDGVPVGLIATAYGCQATGSTLSALRSIVHALRGWPTPLGAGLNVAGGLFRDGECLDAGAMHQLELVGRQVVEFAHMRRTHPAENGTRRDSAFPGDPA